MSEYITQLYDKDGNPVNAITVADAVKMNEEGKTLTDALNETNAQLSNVNNFGYQASTLDNKKRWEGIYINVKDFGAVGDGVNDDTNAIKNAIDSMVFETNFSDSKFYVLLIPNGWYRITDTILINKSFDVVALGNIVYDGTLDKPAIRIQNTNYKEYTFNCIIDMGTKNHRHNKNDTHSGTRLYYSPCNWDNQNFKGIEMINNKACKLKVNLIQGFTVGLDCVAKGGGWWFNHIDVLTFSYNRIGLQLTSEDVGDSVGWLNANYFYNSQFGTKPRKENEDVWDIKQNLLNGNTYGGNSNYFSNLKFETHGTYLSKYIHLELKSAVTWAFVNCRIELTSTDSIGYKIYESHSDKRSCFDISFINSPFASADGGVQIIRDSEWGTISGGTHSDFNPPTIINNNDEELKYTLFNVEDLHLNSYVIDGKLYHPKLNGKHGGSIINGCRDASIDYTNNCVNISLFYPIVFELTNLNLGDYIRITDKAKNNFNRTDVMYSFYDENDTLLSSVKLTGGYKHYDSGYDYSWTTSGGFRVSDSTIKKIRCRVYGTLESIQIISNNNQINVTNYFNDKITYPHLRNQFQVDSTPKTTDEIPVGTIVYYKSNPYQLQKSDSSLSWVAL